MTKLVTYTIELGETDIFTASILIVYGTGSRNEFFLQRRREKSNV